MGRPGLCALFMLLPHIAEHSLQLVILLIRHPVKSIFIEEFCGALTVRDGYNCGPGRKQALIAGSGKLQKARLPCRIN